MYLRKKIGKAQSSLSLKNIFITHEFPPFHGGVSTYADEVTRAAERLGLPVVVWTGGRPHPAVTGKNVVHLGTGTSLHFFSLIKFGWAIFRRRQELTGKRVILGSVGAQLVFWHLAWLGLGRRSEVIPLFHGSEIFRYERNVWLGWLAEKFLAKSPYILVASHFTKDRLQQSRFEKFCGEVRVAPCAVRSSILTSSEALPCGRKAREGTMEILTLARVHPRKGQLDTVRALGLLTPELRHRVIYRMAGTGEAAYAETVLAQGRACGVNVVYAGAVRDEELAVTYASCDIYAMTSLTLARSVEGFGMTYLEAGCFAKPVVGYRTGGVMEAVRDGQTGLLVKEGDIAALAEALRQLIEDAPLRERLGRAGREYALSFDWGKTAEILFNPRR